MAIKRTAHALSCLGDEAAIVAVRASAVGKYSFFDFRPGFVALHDDCFDQRVVIQLVEIAEFSNDR